MIARFAIPLALCATIILGVAYEYGSARSYVVGHRGAFAADSADSSRREITSTPSTRSDYMHDSLSKPIRFLTKSGDTTTKYVPRDMLMRAYDGYTYTGRDSVYEFVDTTCIKWYMRLPDSKTRHVRIYAIDTCSGQECTPMLGDEDNTFKSGCDSVKIRGLQSWVHVFYMTRPQDGATALGKTMYVSVDTMWVPFTFTIVATQDSAKSTYAPMDSTNRWFSPLVPSISSNATAFPIGASMYVKHIAWTSACSNGSLYGGKVVFPSHLVFSPHMSMMLRWITNPVSRAASTDPTKLSVYMIDLTYGATPNVTTPTAPTFIGQATIDDGGTHGSAANKNKTIVLMVTVWAYYLSNAN